MGVQGRKRKDILGNYCTSTVDPYSNLANYKRIEEVPLNSFDAAFVCTPDSVKLEIIEYLVKNRKHVLCEKPLSLSSSQDFDKLEILTNQQKIALYTAYNHNFEGSIKEAREIIQQKKWLAEQLGKSYNMVNSYIQNRQQPRLEVLFEIAEILQVDAKELLKSKTNV